MFSLVAPSLANKNMEAEGQVNLKGSEAKKTKKPPNKLSKY